MRKNWQLWVLAGLLALTAGSNRAEDTFFHSPVSSLQFLDGKLPESIDPTDFRKQTAFLPVMQPYAVLDGEGEIYVGGQRFEPWGMARSLYQDMFVAVRASRTNEITGRLFVPKSDLSGMTVLKFKMKASDAKPDSKQQFAKAREAHYHRLYERNLPGAAWFRHEQNEAAKAAGMSAATPAMAPGRFQRQPTFMGNGDLDSTFELFSGGRAISENLQLDRALALAGNNPSNVSITNLQGIAVRQMDWKPLVKDLKPVLDRLAASIPYDQHALFFPSFQAMTEFIDQADTDGTPVLRLFESRAEDANARGRYQKQLCLEMNDLSRLLGPQVITSVAFTGSDPYLRTGTDVGVLFETRSGALLQNFILARHAATRKANPAVKAVSGDIDGVSYSGVVLADRSISSYVAALDDVVLVCNSTYQLSCLIETAHGKRTTLASQDEYIFFRAKYAKGDPNETAFLVLTDATIRRWCGPRWRIANSRRTRIAASLAEAQAAHLDQLIAGKVPQDCRDTNLVEGCAIEVTATGAMSQRYGTLEFLTPIAELPLEDVTRAEADAYNRWREGYEQNWTRYFDPIAVRFSTTARRLAAELTVIPLIAGTEYRDVVGLTRGGQIAPGAGDPHPETLFHLAVAIDQESPLINGAGDFLGGFSPSLRSNPLGWLGGSIAIYADRDPFWDELNKSDKPSDFIEKNLWRVPLALRCEVKNPLGMTAFLAGARAFIDQTAPRMTVWQNFDYKGQAYVKVLSRQNGEEGSGETNAVYYAVTPKSLVITLSETVLKRALDRQTGGEQAGKEKKSGDAIYSWVGKNIGLQAGAEFAPVLETVFRDQYRSSQQVLAWNNLPILNEWKRRYPSLDPVEVHEQFWQTRLPCPGGGSYVWNDKFQTMESTVYGHPGEPKEGPKTIPSLAGLSRVNLGLTFENQGLSAKVVLDRKSSSQ
jgi:hypothetical protein